MGTSGARKEVEKRPCQTRKRGNSKTEARSMAELSCSWEMEGAGKRESFQAMRLLLLR
jgi:hypothetical protein